MNGSESRLHRMLKIAFLVVLTFSCSSCVIKPGYRPELHSSLFAARTGRPFESSRHLPSMTGSSFVAFAHGCAGLDAERIVGAPAFLAANTLLCPVWDVLNLPRDLYIRNCGGVTVSVHHPDGVPVSGATVLACEGAGGGEREIGVFQTDSDGMTYIPRKSDTVRIKYVSLPGENSEDFFTMPFENPHGASGVGADGAARIDVIIFQHTTSYAPFVGTIDMPLHSEEKRKPRSWLVNVDLATANCGNPPFRPDARLQIEWSGAELSFHFPFFGGSFPFVMVDNAEEFCEPGSGASAFQSDMAKNIFFVRHDISGSWEVAENALAGRQWMEANQASALANSGEMSMWRSPLFPKRIRKGIPENRKILFKVGERYGILSEFHVEYGGDLLDPVLHLKWIFNLEPGKDWFDMDGVPVKVVTSPENDD